MALIPTIIKQNYELDT